MTCGTLDISCHRSCMWPMGEPPGPHGLPSRVQAVAALLTSLVSGAPAGWRLVLDDATGDAASAAAVFHFEDAAGRRVPLSSGMAFYTVDQARPLPGQPLLVWPLLLRPTQAGTQPRGKLAHRMRCKHAHPRTALCRLA